MATNMVRNRSLYIPFCLIIISTTLPSRWYGWAWDACSPDRGGGACPSGNTCCAIPAAAAFNGDGKRQQSFVSGCIPNDLGSFNGTCCHDDPTTGCAVGYMCGPEQQCFFVGTTNNQEPIDPYVQVLPRYCLCQEPNHPASASFRHVYGFPVVVSSNNSNEMVHLWYYSSHGEVTKLSKSQRQNIQRALIFIHGAARNADDYFCVAVKAAQLYQQRQQSTKDMSGDILVLAPRFVTPTDQPFDKDASKIPNMLQWSDNGSGPWRYGANAILPPIAATYNISSYTAMDQVVSFLGNATLFPNLHHLTIAGHSSGGQFVQRYSLLTSVVSSIVPSTPSTVSPSTVSETTSTINRMTTQSANIHKKVKPFHVRFVVANPSSYAYLTPFRFVEEWGSWILPQQQQHPKENTTAPSYANTSCVPQYNQYPWGLQSSVEDATNATSAIVVPYKDRALEAVNQNVTTLIRRFLQHRQVVYLVGSVDRCNLSSTIKLDNATHPMIIPSMESTISTSSNNSNTAAVHSHAIFVADDQAWRKGEWWCESHGLETSCMDLWQGSNRWFRHVHYMNSLKLAQQQYLRVRSSTLQPSSHTSNVVEGVGHDHSLIFLSAVGLDALWGSDDGLQ